VSPLWRDEVGIYLAQRRVCMVRMRKGIRPTVSEEHDQKDPSRAAGWEAALDLLEQRLIAHAWSNLGVRVVVADHWVRYAIVPWSDALSSTSERLGHARELLAGVFGQAMSDWTVSLSEGPPGVSRLASAMPTALLEALRRQVGNHQLKLLSVQPRLIAAHNAWRHVLPAKEPAWFVTVEDGSLAALRMCGDGVDLVHVVRIGQDWARELRRLQTFGRLASASPADGRVYVDLPHSLRALQGEAPSELHWLDDPNPPVSTLHRLEQLRRSAA
jgi:hypothetical protein